MDALRDVERTAPLNRLLMDRSPNSVCPIWTHRFALTN